eukprot:Selendium_serpulae@DN5515_c1_g1_i11.p1
MDDVLSVSLLKTIASKGYSRVPVLNNNPHLAYPKVESVLLLKDLMLVEDDDEVRVEDMVRCLGCKVYAVDKDTSLLSVLDTLLHLHDRAPTDAAIAGVHVKSHLVVLQEAIECEDQDNVIRDVGFVTLEDVLETLLGRHVLDETELRRAISASPSPASEARITTTSPDNDYTRLFDPQRGPIPLSEREAHLIASFLLKRIPAELVRLPPEIWRIPLGEWLTGHPVLDGSSLSSSILFEEGEKVHSTILILQGSVHSIETFSKAGAWSVLCLEALVKDHNARETICICDCPAEHSGADKQTDTQPASSPKAADNGGKGRFLYLEISGESFLRWHKSVEKSSPRHTAADVEEKGLRALEISADPLHEADKISLKSHSFAVDTSVLETELGCPMSSI